jgi:hypothetical protein
MPTRRFLPASAALVALAIALLPPAPARADCEPAGPIEEALAVAPVAFVGTVTALDGPAARFAVAEVWAGSVGATVEVRGLGDGGPDTGFGAAFMEDDRRWSMGTTYLVVPFVDGTVLRDHLCTATTEWRDELAALRPPGATTPTPEALSPGTGIPAALAVLAAAAAVGAIGWLAFRRR